MGLIGRLSNQETTALYQCLTSRDWRKSRRERQSENVGPAPDGRRSFGSVSRTIIQVLAQAGAELSVSEIHRRVEEELGGSVAASSIKMYLRRGCRQGRPIFTYCGQKGYRLRVSSSPRASP
jgi:hypothetical protein